MSETLEIIPVNERQNYHDCELIFSLEYENPESSFTIDKAQKYSIFTTIKEVAVLNEALQTYQVDGFKEMFLLYSAEADGNKKYPEFTTSFNKATLLGKQLQTLANDDDKLIQLQEYYLDIVPTYKDDFMIDKNIEAIIIDGKETKLNGYEEVKKFLLALQKEKPSLFK